MTWFSTLPGWSKRIVRRLIELRGFSLAASVGLEKIDLQLSDILAWKRNGLFVEAGAFDGIRQSNTYYLERHLGWRGLLVEPDPDIAKQCRYNRPRSIVEQCCLVSSSYSQQNISLRQAGLMSVVDDDKIDQDWALSHVTEGRRIQRLTDVSTIKVPANPLHVLFKKHDIKEIDFFSLDVEGYELEVLHGIDFNAVQIHNIFIECRTTNEIAITELLAKNGLLWDRRWENRQYTNILFRDTKPAK